VTFPPAPQSISPTLQIVNACQVRIWHEASIYFGGRNDSAPT